MDCGIGPFENPQVLRLCKGQGFPTRGVGDGRRAGGWPVAGRAEGVRRVAAPHELLF